MPGNEKQRRCWTSATRAAFGNGEGYLEKMILRARHVEVQILGDHHGHLVHLWERDCSVQRRHQKVVEVAPSINLPYELRKAICEAAVRLCREIGYVCAGTVEFLVDLDTEEFFFIEVNPRVQVEHTVTEMVTGRMAPTETQAEGGAGAAAEDGASSCE